MGIKDKRHTLDNTIAPQGDDQAQLGVLGDNSLWWGPRGTWKFRIGGISSVRGPGVLVSELFVKGAQDVRTTTMKYNPNWRYAEAPVSFIRLEERKVDDCPYDPDDLAWSYKMALRRLGRVRKSVKTKYNLSMRAMRWGCTDGGLTMWLIEVAHLTKNGDVDGSKETSREDLMKVMRELIPDHEEYHTCIYPHDT